ncbi:MAG: hypothetical protein KDE53_38420, partial [Caldilineaceae bacterium]|nr:hypothetical protein [Caldilineaceae bacterium]
MPSNLSGIEGCILRTNLTVGDVGLVHDGVNTTAVNKPTQFEWVGQIRYWLIYAGALLVIRAEISSSAIATNGYS